MMFYLWDKKNIDPFVFEQYPESKKIVYRAFYEKVIDNENKKHRAMERAGINCPFLF